MGLTTTIKENLTRENGPSAAEPHIESLGGAIYKLEITGKLAPGWVARLSTGLANHQINVLRFKAEKTTPIEWSATLELDFSASQYLPDSIDYLKLAKDTKTPPAVESVKLDTLKVDKSTKHGGCLFVELTGPDRIGFLAALVNMFGMYSLNPVEINIETVENRVFDRFWLKGLGGSTPSESATKAVFDRLTAYAA
jgi:hypothetical protein